MHHDMTATSLQESPPAPILLQSSLIRENHN